jgi:hypothetical protein
MTKTDDLQKFTLHVFNRVTDQVLHKKEILATRTDAERQLGDLWNERAASEPNRGWIAKLYNESGDQVSCIDGDDDPEEEDEPDDRNDGLALGS